VATKFGMRREHDASGSWGVCGRPAGVRACLLRAAIEASLHRLGLELWITSTYATSTASIPL
jgi:aryl-alcohol dehydrogenase-like predicted oxidoreductase